MEKTTDTKDQTPKKWSAKRIAAIICIVLLVALYIITLLAAIFDKGEGMHLFAACVVATIGLPILLWIYLLCYGYYAKKHTIADLDILQNVDADTRNDNSDETK